MIGRFTRGRGSAGRCGLAASPEAGLFQGRLPGVCRADRFFAWIVRSRSAGIFVTVVRPWVCALTFGIRVIRAVAFCATEGRFSSTSTQTRPVDAVNSRSVRAPLGIRGRNMSTTATGMRAR